MSLFAGATPCLRSLARTAALVLLGMANLAFGDEGLVKTLAIGEPAPDFNLLGIDGRNHSLQDYAGAKLLMVIFTANHCKTAQAYESRIIRLAEDYRGRGVAIVAIAPNDPQAVGLSELVYSDLGDSFEELKLRAKERGFNFPYLYDGDSQKVSRAYGPVSTPHAFLFDAQRRLRYVGRIDNAENEKSVTQTDARNALEALLAGRPVPVERTKTFGCSIKWSEKRAAVQKELDSMAKEPVSLETVNLEGIRKLVRDETPKLLLINVWATWCGPCLRELPELVTMNRMYRNGNFELVTICADAPDRKERALGVLKERQVAARNYIMDKEDNDALSTALDPEWPGGLPYSILVAPGGKIIQRQMGEIDAMKVKRVVALYPGR
jgi:thiol-disulfide isomerase/thioredoxin